MIGGFASKVKKAADGFERHWPMSGRAESCWPAAGDVVQKCRVRSGRRACRGVFRPNCLEQQDAHGLGSVGGLPRVGGMNISFIEEVCNQVRYGQLQKFRASFEGC